MTRRADRASAPKTQGLRIRWPRWYDWANRFNFLGREDEFRHHTLDLAEITAGEAILDVGCGTGNLTLLAREATGNGGEVHGVDAAPEMIREAERKAAVRRLEVNFQVGLIEDLSFEDARFDVVLSSLMLHHLPPSLKRRGVAEIARVLRPGGRFLAVDVDPPLIGNLRIVEEAVRANGLIEIERGKTGFRSAFVNIHYLRASVTDPDAGTTIADGT